MARPTKFKDGDRVIVKHTDYPDLIPLGSIQTVKIDKDGDVVINSLEVGDLIFWDEELELVVEATSKKPPLRGADAFKCARSLYSAITEAGGNEQVADRLFEGSFEQAFDILARNNIRFVYKP